MPYGLVLCFLCLFSGSAFAAGRSAMGNNYQNADLGNHNLYVASPDIKDSIGVQHGETKSGGIYINDNILSGNKRMNTIQNFQGGSHNKIYGPSIEIGRITRK